MLFDIPRHRHDQWAQGWLYAEGHPEWRSPRTRIWYSINAMAWGLVELEPEVADWLESLPTANFATVAFYIDLLADQGPLLSEPYTRQLDGKLRELRLHLNRQAMRISYWIAPGRRIVLMTVFTKSSRQAPREIQRAKRALACCIADEHTTDKDENND